MIIEYKRNDELDWSKESFIQSFLEKERKEFERLCEIEHFKVGEIDKALFVKFLNESNTRLLEKVRELFPEESEDFRYISEDVREFARQLRDSLDNK